MNAIDAYENTNGTNKRTKALKDVLVLCAFSLLPPDRVGVIRKLKLGYTLKWECDDDGGGLEAEERHEQSDVHGSGRYWIDLTDRSTRHKTSRFYGPAATKLPKMFSMYIHTFIALRRGGDVFDFDESDDGYLFAAKDGRAHTVSAWTKVVKDAFRRHSSSGLAPAPKLLRSIFITWLRGQAADNKATPDVLKACSIAMKHNLDTQASDVYDKKTHERLTQASFDFTTQYALACQVARDRGDQMPTASTAGGDSRDGGVVDGGTTPTRGRHKSVHSKEVGQLPSTPVHSAATPTAKTPNPKVARCCPHPELVGMPVRKEFPPLGWFDGVVERYHAPFYVARFKDGDKEDWTEEEVRGYLSESRGGSNDLNVTDAVADADANAVGFVGEGTRVEVFWGVEAGWIGGEVVRPARRSDPLIEIDGQQGPSTRVCAFFVAFDDGESVAVDLRPARTGAVETPGAWRIWRCEAPRSSVGKAPRRRNSKAPSRPNNKGSRRSG